VTNSSENSRVYDSRAFFGDLAKDWRDRLRGVDPYNPVVPAAGLDIPERNSIANLYGEAISNWSGLSAEDTPEARLFYREYGKYQDAVKSALQELGAVPIRERFRRFAEDTGLGDYEPAAEYNNPGAFNAAQHEIYAHQIPFEEGFAPDYRSFYAGKDRQGNPVTIRANTAFPLNENLAETGETDLGLAFRGYPLRDPSSYTNILSGHNTDSFRLAALGYQGNFLDPSSKNLLETRVELAYPTEYRDSQGQRVPAVETADPRIKTYLTEAGGLFQDKYVLPAAEQMRGLISSQFPGLDSPSAASKLSKSADILPNRYVRFLQELDKKYGGDVGNLGNFFYGVDPLTAGASALPEVFKNIKKAPSSLLPGAADLIPSPEAIRTGYAQGPVEMGKQMAQEFAQSLPTAAGAAMLLSTPAVAPFAPGIGAGLVGVAGARALNEVVRQETGEGIVPKVRQFLGTAPRTGVSAPTSQGTKPLVAEIKPLTAAQKQQMYKNETRSEMQRRMDLARERFNPRKGEFGLSELLFGR
jgi:hypothetical protein